MIFLAWFYSLVCRGNGGGILHVEVSRQPLFPASLITLDNVICSSVLSPVVQQCQDQSQRHTLFTEWTLQLCLEVL